MLAESSLTTANVNPEQFGKLYTRYVDGDIYAQPLYVEGVDIPNRGQKNVVYVVTMRNNVYAFDADDHNPDPRGGLIWGPFHLGTPEQGRVDWYGRMSNPDPCLSAAWYGITGTPVIDPTNNWLYLVAKTIDEQGKPHQMLHRLDIRTGGGANPNSANVPTEVVTAGPGQAVFSHQVNRAGLLLSSGRLYVAFGGHCDLPKDRERTPSGSYHGWVVVYDARTLAKLGQFNTSPNGVAAGVWQSGNGLAADQQGNVYFQTGNSGNIGEPPYSRKPGDLNETIIRIDPGLMNPIVFPRPDQPPPPYLDWRVLDAEDLDLASSGPLLMPDSRNADLIAGGKPGRLYLLDRATMQLKQTFKAGVNASHPGLEPEKCTYGPDQYIPAQSPSNTLCPHIHSGLGYWQGPELNVAYIYLWSERDYLRAYRYDVTRGLIVDLQNTPLPAPPATNLAAPNASKRASVLNPLNDPYDNSRVMPGGTLSISANRSRAGTGIVWATQVLRDNAEYKNVYGVLRAFDAETLRELWNSGASQFEADFLGKHAKYAPVTVAAGKVFTPTFDNRLVVYGLRAHARPFVAPWQEWVDLGELPTKDKPIVIASNAAVTPIARHKDIVDLYLTDLNGTVLNAGSWVNGSQWRWGYVLPKGNQQPSAVPGAPIAALARRADVVDLFATVANGSIWNVARWAAGVPGSGAFGWNPGYAIPGASAGFAQPGTPIAALARTPGVVDLYVVRANGEVSNAGRWVENVPGPGPFGWNTGYAIPGAGPGFASPGTPVAAVKRTEKFVDLYLVRADGSVWNAGRWAEGVAGPGPFNWNAGYPIPGAGAGFAKPGTALAVVQRGTRIVDLYAVRSDGSVWNAGRWAEGVVGPGPFGWNAGYQIPGAGPGFARPGSAVAAVVRDENHVDLYVVRPDGSVWNAGSWAADVQGPGPFGWNPGYRIGLDRTVDPSAVITGLARLPSHVDLFVAGLNGQVFSPWWDAGMR